MSPQLSDVCVVDPLVIAERVGHHPGNKNVKSVAVPGGVDSNDVNRS